MSNGYSFSDLVEEGKKKKKKPFTFEELVSESDEGGFWEGAKDVAGAIGGGTMEVLHQIGRPGSAIIGGAYNIQEELMGKGGDEDRSLWEKYVGETLEGAKKGFTYEDEKRFQDLIAQANPQWVKDHPILSTIAGFAGDVITDPLNLLGVGAVRHALGGFGTAKKLSDAIGKTAAGQKMAEAADNPVLRAFNVYTGDKKVARELYLNMLNKVGSERVYIQRGAKLEQKELKEAANKLGVTVEDLERQIAREIEGMPTSTTIGKSGAPITKGGLTIPENLTGAARVKAEEEAAQMREMFGDFLSSERADVPIRGVAPEGFTGPVQPAGYIKGAEIEDILKGTGRKDLGVKGYLTHVKGVSPKKYQQTVRDHYRHHPSMVKRDLPGTLEDQTIKFGKDFMIRDIPTIKGVRKGRNVQFVAGQNFLKEAAEQMGRRVDDAPHAWTSKGTVKGIDGVVFDPEVAKMVTNMHETLTDAKKFGAFLKTVDGATNWWKMWSLGLRPAYHARNAIGNLWNAYNIGGMSPTSIYKDGFLINKKLFQAGRIQQQSVRGSGFSGTTNLGKKFKKEDGSSYSNEELWRMATEDGVLNHGQYGADVGRALERFALEEAPRTVAQRIGAWVTPSTKNRVLKGGFAAGRAIENNARLGLYLDTLAKTGSRRAASSNVKKSLFDYTDLSTFEQGTMKRLIPFYTWSRKNIPAQIEALAKNPQRAAKLGYLIDNIQYGIDTPSLDEINEFIRKRDPVFIDKFFESGGGDVHNVITLMNYIPLMDVDRLLDWGPMRPGETGGGGLPIPHLISEMTNPFLKSTLEAFFNYDIYRRRDISDYGPNLWGKDERGMPPQRVDFLGVRMPVHLAKLGQNLVMLSEFDRLNPFGVFGERTRTPEGKEEKTRAKLKMPWEDEAALRESRLDQPMSFRLLQYLVGLRPYEVKEDASKWENMNVFKDYNALMKLLRKAAGSGKLDTIVDIKGAMMDMRRTVEGR